MLKLLQSIFGRGETHDRYPESLIEMAIERTLDGTYPRLRALSTYKKRLREPVIHAIDHVIALVDSIPTPIAANPATHADDPRLGALFVSSEHLCEVLVNDAELSEFRSKNPLCADPVHALLVAEPKEKTILGVEMVGEMLCRDVPQVTVSFRNHRLIDPSIDEEEARRQLKRRAFDHLISLALSRIIDAKGERAELNQQRALMRSKLAVLNKGGWAFSHEPAEIPDPTAIQTELEQIEAQLAALTVDESSFDGQLEILAETMASAEQQLWTATTELHLDRLNIKRAAGHPEAKHLMFSELHNARGQIMTILFVSIDPGSLPLKASLAASADRLLNELGPSGPPKSR